MAKWHGKIGYGTQVEEKPGIWKDQIVEKIYTGDLVRNASSWSVSSNSTNDNININNQISIIADPFAYENFHSIKYLEFMGNKWKVTSVEVSYPRLILSIGGLYNG